MKWFSHSSKETNKKEKGIFVCQEKMERVVEFEWHTKRRTKRILGFDAVLPNTECRFLGESFKILKVVSNWQQHVENEQCLSDRRQNEIELFVRIEIKYRRRLFLFSLQMCVLLCECMFTIKKRKTRRGKLQIFTTVVCMFVSGWWPTCLLLLLYSYFTLNLSQKQMNSSNRLKGGGEM